MPSFRDTQGREWPVELNVTTVRRIQSALGFNLLDIDKPAGPGQQNLGVRLVSDPLLVCEILYQMLRPKLDAAGLTEEQFGEAMDAGALAMAYGCFTEAVIDFFRKLGRTELATGLEQAARVIRLAAEEAARRIAAVDVAALAKTTVEDQFRTTAGN